MIGSKLGPYEIVASIGSGGMGEVYRARDPRLKRDIAIKILPAEVVSNPERQKRFQIEAQAASALNHPNILSVYDIGSENGSYYMVSELIEGDSLRKFIQRGPLPVKQLLEIAVQIAAGLASAHEAGIVHRDLKPENIMVTRDGRAKILDFGLAKLRTFPGGEEDETVSHTLTQTGFIQGTIPYMSPEQAAGRPIDFRSDQFSLGLILYEMTTGKRAFARNSGVQTLSAIISEEFPPIRAQNPKIPAPLCWLIERCLSKESRLRYHSTADLEQELRGLQAHLAEAASTVPTASTPYKKFTGTKVIIALLALALLAAVVAAGRLFRTGSDTSLSSYRFTPLATDQAPEDDAAWSPDGKSIAYTAQVNGAQQIFTRSLSSLMNERVTQWEKQSTKPFWSSDGTRIYFFSKGEQQMSLWAIGVAGGSPVKILENAIPPGTISSDGKNLVFFREDSLMNRSLWVSTPPGSTPKKLQSISDKHYGTAIAHFSPDGSKLGVWLWPWRGTSASSFSEFWILPYPQGKPYKAVQDLSDREVRSFSWMRDNRHFVFESSSHSMTGSNIWMADTKQNRIEPITVNMQNESNPSVSPDGQKIAFTVLTSDSNLVEVPLHGASMRSLLSTSRYEEFPSWAPSGDAYAYVADRYGAMGIWLKSLTLGWERPVVTASDFDKDATVRFQSPNFSPDGRRILYRRLAVKGEPAIWISNIAGGPPVRLVQEDRGHGLATWSPDGNWIAYVYAIPGTFGLAKIKVGSGERSIDLTNVIPVRAQDSPKWSPTGNWISCQTQEGLVLVSPDGRNKRILSSNRPIIHGWSKDGSRIYTIRDEDSLHLILTSIDIENLRETRLSELGSSLNLASVLGFSMNPDGKSFATSVEYWNSDLWLLEGFNMRPGLWNRIFGN